jgi:hypothetical protein
MKQPTLKSFIGKRAKFDEYQSGYIWGVQQNGGLQPIAEVRGYGAIQKLFLTEKGCDFEKADKFQDDLGRFIADAINEKLERDSLN